MSEKNESRDWELTCDHCDGDGFVYVERRVGMCATDVQEFKEECECCEGRGFTIAFEDIPGIAEYVKSCPAPSAPGDAQDERQAFEEQPYGWLYDWTHSSATGRPDEHYTGFTTDEAHAKKHDNPRAVYLDAPAAGDALDAKRYRWLRDHIQEDHSLPGSFWLSDTGGESWDKTIDAAMDYQRQQGDAA